MNATARQQIDQLDRQIARKGQSVVWRPAATPDASKDKGLRVFVRQYKPDELSGGITQGDSTIVVSPTAMKAAGIAEFKKTDRITVAGRPKSVLASESVMTDDVLVRVNLWVRG
jgi:hypothetical protein